MPKFTILEPMSTGDIIDRAVRLYRRNFTSLIGIVAVPTLIGYVASLIFWYGYANLFLTSGGASAAPDDAIWMLILGILGYPVWLFSLLVTVAGLSRVIGDHVMMGEPISLRKCFSTVRRKLGDITVMGLLTLVIVFGIYIALVLIFLIILIVIGIIGSIVIAAHLPQLVATVIMVIAVIIGMGFALIVISFIVARVIFLPQVVMIEGESAGGALGRAGRLGKGNWYKVGAIVLFAYFVSMSLMWALMLPVLAGLYLGGMVGPDFYASPTWNIFFAAFKEVSNLLTLPIWIISYTLLYFDSRVRKEAYDVELLAREVGPGFIWQPTATAQPAFAGYTYNRAHVQTSPLGLSGMIPRAPAPQPPALNQNPVLAPPVGVVSAGGGPPSEQPEPPGPATGSGSNAAITDNISSSSPSQTGRMCEQCGNLLESRARFCLYCGKAVEQASGLRSEKEIQ